MLNDDALHRLCLCVMPFSLFLDWKQTGAFRVTLLVKNLGKFGQLSCNLSAQLLSLWSN